MAIGKLKISYKHGLIYLLLFDILSAAQSVWLSSLLQGLDVYSVLFIIFLIVSLFFLTLNFVKKKKDKKEITLKDFLNFLYLNFATLGSWLFLYLSLKFIEPALTAAILYGVNPFATLIISFFILRNVSHSFSAIEIIVSLGTIISMLYVGYIATGGHSSLPNENLHLVLLGLLMAMATGFCMAFVNVITKSIYNNGYSLYQVMSYRFFILLIVSWSLSENLGGIIENNYVALILIAVFGNIFPLFVLQKGINLSSTGQVAYILLLTPLLVYIFQFLDKRLELSIHSLLGISSVLLFSFVGLYLEQKKLKNENKEEAIYE